MKYILLLISLLQGLLTYSQNPPMVWIDADGGERNEYIYFRRDVVLDNNPTTATIHLYADSRYALYVNEVYMGFGPARTFHKHPTFDSYDIAPFLKKGKNTIAVKALSNGMVTYQLFDYKGGFTAWGEINDGKTKIDLSVDHDWLCKKSEGYDQSAARFSFATGAIENLDTRKDLGWNQSATTTSSWSIPIKLLDQELWGPLQPRIIPHLTQKEITAVELLGAYTLDTSEDIYSFRIPTNAISIQKYNQSHSSIAYTYIYSPENKEIITGLWWGEYYLNGKKVIEEKLQKRDQYRKDHKLILHKGWNSFISRHGVIWGSWDYNISLPEGQGLILSPTKEENSLDIFHTYGPFESLDENLHIDNLDLSQKIKPIKKTLLKKEDQNKWKSQARNLTSNHPARDLAWNTIDFNSPFNPKEGLTNILSVPQHTKGTALIYDMGEIQLGRFFIEGDFPDGTIIDIGFSEEKNADGTPWLYKRYQVGAGHRFIASKNKKRYETFKPYGARYLQINIQENNDTAKITKVGMVRQVYPFEQVGSFDCSDPLLTRIWDAGWRTLQLCAEDSYTDTPFRERGLYAGDMLPEAAITMAVSGDTRLLAHSLNVFQDMYHDEMYDGKENVHGDFPLITLVTMDYYLQYTDNWDYVKNHYNNYKSLLKNYLVHKKDNGLIHSNQVFIEWTALNKHDAVMTAQQALIVKSCDILTQWATRLNLPQDALFYENESIELKKSINKTLWDEDTYSYWDGIKNDSFINSHHLTSSVWPALYNVSSDIQKKKITKMLKKELQQVITGHRQNKIAPYSSFYLLAYLYQIGEAKMAEDFIKKHWGPMAQHAAKPTVWENFSINGGDGTSSHAWSGHPTYFMASEALGVNLGFYKKLDRNIIEIAPQSATLSWAKGSVAHPLGKVELEWKIVGNRLVLNYQVPKGAKVVVQPKGRLSKLELWVNERPPTDGE